MKTFVFLLLSLGLFGFAFGNHLRIFDEFNETIFENRTMSLNACKQKNKSLVTVYDKEDLTSLYTISRNTAFWLGLRKRESNVTTWSNGESLTFSRSQVTPADENQICEAMGNRTWEGFNCSDRKPFMCYKDNNYKLIEKKKNWCQALQFCRRHYTDLVSISNETHNEEVFKKGKNNTFWIGLQHDQWEWEDKSCSTYRALDMETEGDCTNIIFTFSLSISTNDCEQHSGRLCVKGNVRIRVVRENLTWEQALDYCTEKHTGLLWIEDAKDQEAVEQWLNPESEGPFWIGLKQSTLFGFWIWSDRTVSYSNWKNDKIPEMPMSNQCGAIMNINGTWKWSDENCWNPLYFLCEEEIVFM